MLIIYRKSDKEIMFNSGKSFINPVGMSDMNGKLAVVERVGGEFEDYDVFRLHDINDSIQVQEILDAYEYNLIFNEQEEVVGYNILKTKEEWIAEQPPAPPSDIEMLKLEQAQSNAEMIDLMMSMLGGI